MAFYSRKVKSFAEASAGSTIGIPNDPAMGARALLLLEKGGVIKLREGAGVKATVLDIVENPKKFKIVELEAAQLPHSLDDLTISAVNGNYASTLFATASSSRTRTAPTSATSSRTRRTRTIRG